VLLIDVVRRGRFGVGVSVVNGTTGAVIAHNLIHHVSGKGGSTHGKERYA